MLDEYKSKKMLYLLSCVVLCVFLIILRNHESSDEWLTMVFICIVAISVSICGFQVGRYAAMIKEIKKGRATPGQLDELYSYASKTCYPGSHKVFLGESDQLSYQDAEMLLSEIAQEKLRSESLTVGSEDEIKKQA